MYSFILHNGYMNTKKPLQDTVIKLGIWRIRLELFPWDGQLVLRLFNSLPIPERYISKMKSGFYISDYTVFAILQTADVILPTVCINNTFLLPNIKRKHQTQHNQSQNKPSTTQSKLDPKHNTAVWINNTFLLLDIHRKHQTQNNQNQNIKHKTSKPQTKHNKKQEHTPNITQRLQNFKQNTTTQTFTAFT